MFYSGNASHSASSAGKGQPATALPQAGPGGSPTLHWPVIRPMTNSTYLPAGGHQYSGQDSFHRSFITWLQLKNRTPSCPCPPQSISTSYKTPSFLATVTRTGFHRTWASVSQSQTAVSTRWYQEFCLSEAGQYQM